MTMWHIQRIDAQAGANSGLVCTSPGQPLAITMYDSDNNVTTVVNTCVDTTSTHPCDLMQILHDAGFTPGDWDTECPPS